MTFILSGQRGEHPAVVAGFSAYREYLASVEGEMPPGAYALATADWWYRFDEPRAPHDAWLEQAMVAETDAGEGRRAVSMTLRLVGPFHDGHIELRYRDVSRYRMELAAEGEERGLGHRDWRYDELRLAPGGRMEHEIEWWGPGPMGTWLIEAADVEYRWVPAEPEAPEAFPVP